jgi:hypothetical protein
MPRPPDSGHHLDGGVERRAPQRVAEAPVVRVEEAARAIAAEQRLGDPRLHVCPVGRGLDAHRDAQVDPRVHGVEHVDLAAGLAEAVELRLRVVAMLGGQGGGVARIGRAEQREPASVHRTRAPPHAPVSRSSASA